MASSQPNDEEENLTRILQLLKKPCRKLMKAFFIQRVHETNPGTSIDGFLKKHETQIKGTPHGHYNRYRYFPLSQQTDLNKWDIVMFYHMTKYCPSDATNSAIYCHLKDIKRIRDTVSHLDDYRLPHNKYTLYRRQIKYYIDGVVSYINDPNLRLEIEEDVRRIDSPIANEVIEAYQGNHVLYSREDVAQLIQGKPMQAFFISLPKQ